MKVLPMILFAILAFFLAVPRCPAPLMEPLTGKPSDNAKKTTTTTVKRVRSKRQTTSAQNKKATAERGDTVAKKVEEAAPKPPQVVEKPATPKEPQVVRKYEYEGEAHFEFARDDGRPAGDVPVTFLIKPQRGPQVKQSTRTDESGHAVMRLTTGLPYDVRIVLEQGGIVQDVSEWELDIESSMVSLVPDEASDVKTGEEEKIAMLDALPATGVPTSSIANYALGSDNKVKVKEIVEKHQLRYPASGVFQCSVTRNVCDYVVDAGDKTQVLEVPDQGAAIPDKDEPVVMSEVSPQADGKFHFILRRDLLDNGGFSIIARRNTSAGEYETIVPASVIGKDQRNPYADNTINLPAPQLVRLTDGSVKTPENIDVFFTSYKDVLATVGRGSENKGEGKSGEEIWHYDDKGFDLCMREYPNDFYKDSPKDSKKDNPRFVEWIRLTSPNAGKIGNLQVGCARSQVEGALGIPNQDYARKTNNSYEIDYVQEGITFTIDKSSDTVKSIQIRRPKDLLEKGTTAFEPGEPCTYRMDASDLDGDMRSIASDLHDHIQGSTAYKEAASGDTADFTIKISCPPITVTKGAATWTKGPSRGKKVDCGEVGYCHSKELNYRYEAVAKVRLTALDAVGKEIAPPVEFSRSAMSKPIVEKHECECHRCTPDDVFGDNEWIWKWQANEPELKQQAREAALASLRQGIHDVGKNSSKDITEFIDKIQSQDTYACRVPVIKVDRDKGEVTLGVGTDNCPAPNFENLGLELKVLIPYPGQENKPIQEREGKRVAVGSRLSFVRADKTTSLWQLDAKRTEWRTCLPDPATGLVCAEVR